MIHLQKFYNNIIPISIYFSTRLRCQLRRNSSFPNKTGFIRGQKLNGSTLVYYDVKTKIQQFEKIRAEAASATPTATPAMCMSTSSMVSNGGISRVRASFLAAHGGGCGDPNNSNKQQQQQMLANSSQQQSQQHLMQQPKVIEDFHSNVKVKELRCMFEVSSAAPPPVSSQNAPTTSTKCVFGFSKAFIMNNLYISSFSFFVYLIQIYSFKNKVILEFQIKIYGFKFFCGFSLFC